MGCMICLMDCLVGLRCLVAYLFGVAACFVLGLATSVGWVGGVLGGLIPD